MGNWQNLPDTSTPLNKTNLDALYDLRAGTVLTSGTDLNNVTTPGAYCSNSVEITNSLSNCPVSNIGFKLIVEYTTATNRIVQTLKVNNANTSETYVRTYTGAWGTWNVITNGRYLTSEQRVGTWTDGKPLYRKVVKSSTFEQSYTLGIPDIAEIVNVQAIVHRKDYSNLYDKIPSRLNNSQYYIDFANIDKYQNGKLDILWGSSHSSSTIQDITFIVEYTKTTD